MYVLTASFPQYFEQLLGSHPYLTVIIEMLIAGFFGSLYAFLEILRNYSKFLSSVIRNGWGILLLIGNAIVASLVYGISIYFGYESGIRSAIIIGLFLPLAIRGKLYQKSKQVDQVVSS